MSYVILDTLSDMCCVHICDAAQFAMCNSRSLYAARSEVESECGSDSTRVTDGASLGDSSSFCDHLGFPSLTSFRRKCRRFLHELYPTLTDVHIFGILCTHSVTSGDGEVPAGDAVEVRLRLELWTRVLATTWLVFKFLYRQPSQLFLTRLIGSPEEIFDQHFIEAGSCLPSYAGRGNCSFSSDCIISDDGQQDQVAEACCARIELMLPVQVQTVLSSFFSTGGGIEALHSTLHSIHCARYETAKTLRRLYTWPLVTQFSDPDDVAIRMEMASQIKALEILEFKAFDMDLTDIFFF